MSHVDDGQLEMWLDRSRSGMAADEIERIKRHFDSCAVCAARLAEATRMRQRAESILSGLQLDERRMPEFERVVARAAGGSSPTPRASHSRRWVALAWAASIVAAIGLGWVTRDLFAPGQLALEDSAVQSSAVTESAQPAAFPDAERASPVESGVAAPSAVAPAPAVSANTAEAGPEGEPAERAGPDPMLGRPTAVAFRGAVTESAAEPVAAPAAPPSEPAALVARSTIEPERQAAQGGTVVARGRVTGPEGDPLPGVIIRLGSEARTLTTADGDFRLAVPTDELRPDSAPTVTAEALGYEPQTIALVGGDTMVADIQLARSAIALEAIVALGYADREATPAAPPPEAQTRQVSATADAASAAASEDAVPVPARAPAPASSGERVTPEEASRRLGVPIVTIPELPVLSIELAEDGPDPVVHVRQRTEDGSTVLLVQAAGTPPRLPDVAGDPTIVRASHGRLYIAAVAMLDAAVLEALVASVE